MTSFLRVRVQSIHDDHLVLLLPDGTSLQWPIESSPIVDTPAYTAGDELILTLTQSIELLNELLTNTDHGQITQTKNNPS